MTSYSLRKTSTSTTATRVTTRRPQPQTDPHTHTKSSTFSTPSCPRRRAGRVIALRRAATGCPLQRSRSHQKNLRTLRRTMMRVSARPQTEWVKRSTRPRVSPTESSVITRTAKPAPTRTPPRPRTSRTSSTGGRLGHLQHSTASWVQPAAVSGRYATSTATSSWTQRRPRSTWTTWGSSRHPSSLLQVEYSLIRWDTLLYFGDVNKMNTTVCFYFSVNTLANAKLYNIYTMLDQRRRRRYVNVIQMYCVCWDSTCTLPCKGKQQ